MTLPPAGTNLFIWWKDRNSGGVVDAIRTQTYQIISQQHDQEPSLLLSATSGQAGGNSTRRPGDKIKGTNALVIAFFALGS
jgi:hypothetical protein